MSFVDTRGLPAPRRPTYYFLQFAKRFSPVYLTADVDASALRDRRAGWQEREGARPGHVAFVIWATARALRKFPEANASVRHSRLPGLVRHADVHAKFTLDKYVAGERVVVPGLVRDADRLSLGQIQERVAYYRDGKVDELEEFSGARVLRRLPPAVGQLVYNLALSNLAKRSELQGSFTVTSLGHLPITNFLPVVSTSVCLGVGAASEKVVAVDGKPAVRPILPLTMGFDHCAMDGALAGELLSEIKAQLEGPLDADIQT